MNSIILDISKTIHARGGRALLVGGYVRDRLLGIDSKDVDIEVFALSLDSLTEILTTYGAVIEVGRAFGVLRVKGLDIDFSLPRIDSKVGTGHRGFDVATDPTLDFKTAAKRRDVSINAMGFDPLTDEILDPHGGRKDLEQHILRATDPAHFAEDPLRGLRVAQFAARFEMAADEQLLCLSSTLPLDEIAPERIFNELHKLLIKGRRPSTGFDFLRQSTLIRFFPEIEALIGVEQDPRQHPEGDVWTHTMMAIDQAAQLRAESADDLALMLGALCHDFDKPAFTELVNGSPHADGCESKGVLTTRRFLERLRAPRQLILQVEALVEHHLAPTQFIKNHTGPKGYRHLARTLAAGHIDMTLLYRVARADHLGRTTEQALAHQFPAGETFLAKAQELLVDRQSPRDVVRGRDLIARGISPGPEFRELLEKCRDLQDEHGWRDPERVLDAVLENR